MTRFSAKRVLEGLKAAGHIESYKPTRTDRRYVRRGSIADEPLWEKGFTVESAAGFSVSFEAYGRDVRMYVYNNDAALVDAATRTLYAIGVADSHVARLKDLAGERLEIAVSYFMASRWWE